MSGIEVVYSDKILVSVPVSDLKDNYGEDIVGTSRKSINLVTNYVYKFQSSFQVKEVVKGSPADLAGVKKDDLILKINENPTQTMDLSEIISKFQEKDNKRIRLVLQRDFKRIKVKFRLKKVI